VTYQIRCNECGIVKDIVGTGQLKPKGWVSVTIDGYVRKHLCEKCKVRGETK